MSAKTLPGTVVGLAVAIILAATLLMPALSDATETHETLKNTGVYYMTDTSVTMTYEYNGGTSWTVNGEALDYTTSGSTNILVTDDYFVRNNGNARGSSLNQYWSAASLTVSDGLVTGTVTLGSSTVEISWSCEEVFYGAVNEESDYIMKKGTTDVYVLETDTVYGRGLSAIDSASSTYAIFEVSATGGTATVTCSNSDVTISNIEVNWTAAEGYVDTYVFESITFDSTYNDETVNQTYNQIIVPASISAETDDHLSDGEIALLNVIPILIIVSLVIAAVGIVATGRRD